MGVHANIGLDKFPKQGAFLGMQVKVCFNYDADQWLTGKVVRDDIEEPFRSLIQLSDGRIVAGTECQYSIPQPAQTEGGAL